MTTITKERREEIERECLVRSPTRHPLDTAAITANFDTPSGIFPADPARIARYVDSQVEKALEEACGAMCRSCANGVPLHDDFHYPKGDFKFTCLAWPIRALLAARKEGGA